MQSQVTETNTTAAVTVFSHADIVRVLGLAAMMDAGLPRDVPGTTISVDLGPAEADGEFTATVSSVIDHNYVPPAQPQLGQGDSGAIADPSLNSASLETPASHVVPPVPLVGLQIPGAPVAAVA